PSEGLLIAYYGAALLGAALHQLPFRSLVHPTPKRRFIMTTINLKDFYYWYTQDQFIEVTEEVAGALRASIRYEAAYSELAARINSAPLKKSKSKRLEDAIAAKEKELARE